VILSVKWVWVFVLILDILDALDEMLTKNSQMEKVDPDKILEKIYASQNVAPAPTQAELKDVFALIFTLG
jgi:hypothetical protein